MKKIIAISLILCGCGSDSLDLNCSVNRKIEHVATNWPGRIYYDNDLRLYFVNYFVPGSIDSRYSSVVCNGLDESFRIDGMEVVFSGNLLDDRDEIQPLSLIGGQEFFYLQLTSIVASELE